MCVALSAIGRHRVFAGACGFRPGAGGKPAREELLAFRPELRRRPAALRGGARPHLGKVLRYAVASYNPWALGSNPRRFCSAVALVNDARWPRVPYRKHLVRYSIGEDTGFSGFDWGVEWCVTGYDLNWAYNPNCKMAGP